MRTNIAIPTTLASGAKRAGGRLAFADGLRGIAALWVVLFHMSEGGHIDSFKALLPQALALVIFDHGDLGVAIFFVLSGFVMAFTVKNAKVDSEFATKFILRRLTRLTPPYYFAIAVAVLVGIVKTHVLGAANINISPAVILANMVYLQGIFSMPYINIVFWTLCIEVQFYIAFAILFLLGDSFKHPLAGFSGRAILVLAASLFALLWPASMTSVSVWTGSFFQFWFSFLAGVLVCWACLGVARMRLIAVTYASVVIVAGCISAAPFTVTAGVTALLLTLVGMAGKMDSWLSWGWIQWLGTVSYSLYLLHNPITGTSFRIIKMIIPNALLAAVLGMAFVLVACLTIAWLAYLMVEKPSIKWSHAISLKNRQTSAQ